MASLLERRIEALEVHLEARTPRVAVIHQNEDGTWPPDPSGVSLVIGIQFLGGRSESEDVLRDAH